MLAVRRYGTVCELQLALDSSRVQPDFVFSRYRVAIFVDGCFWHGCPDHGSLPRANRLWWKKKILDNQQRDLRGVRTLRARGWVARRFWAHEKPEKVVSTILRILQRRALKD